MRKHLLILLCVLVCCLSGCGKVNESVELPVPDYPLSKDFISEAIKKSSLPENLLIKENDYTKIEGVKTSFYSIEHPTEEGMPPYLAHCMGLLSHKSDEFSSVGLTISSIDQDRENFSEEEMKTAICFATYLFWGKENDTRIYDAFMKDYVKGKPIIWEKEIDDIDCQIKHDPESISAILNISFSTDMEAQLSPREE